METGSKLRRSYSENDMSKVTRSRSLSPQLRSQAISANRTELFDTVYDISRKLTDQGYRTIVEASGSNSRNTPDLNAAMSELSSVSESAHSVASNLSTKKAMNKFIAAVEKAELLDDPKLTKLKNSILVDKDLTPEKFENYVLQDIPEAERKTRRVLSAMIGQFIIGTDGGHLFTNG